MKSDLQSLVVIGNGMASHRFCEAAVKEGLLDRYRITVIGEESKPAYDRVHLTRYVETGDSEGLRLGGRDWYEKNHIELVVGMQICSVDRRNSRLVGDSGMLFPYDKLVFATGSTPFIPPIYGIDSEGVFPYRTIEDARNIKEYASDKLRAVVLGGGLLGLEAADAMRKLGLTTHVIEFANGLMPRQLSEDGSFLLERELSRLGLNIKLGVGAKTIEINGVALRVTLTDESILDTDMVIVSTGIRPRDELAAEAELQTGARGGIVINDQLQTSDPNIFAIGECALHRGSIYGFVAPAYKMAEALAKGFGGKEAAFEGSDLSCRLKLLGVEVSAFGDYLEGGKRLVYKNVDTYRSIVLRSDKVIGGTTIGKWDQAHQLQLATQEARFFTPGEQRKFERTGRIPVNEGLNDWPANATVCNCVQVTKGTLSQCITNGCMTVAELSKATGAGTVCGSCRPLLSRLVGDTGEEVSYIPKGRRALLIAASLAAVCSVLFWALNPLPVSDTVQSAYYSITKIWTESLYKQISGFTMVGLSIVAMGLSARKRFKKLNFGNFGWWRAVHGIVGALCLLGLLAHTGMNFGENMNLWLMCCFVGLNTAGAVAGITLALEDRLSGPFARRIRNLVTKAHIIFFWPYPALLGFHIYKAYFY